MIEIQLAEEKHVNGIINVCTAGYRFVSEGILPFDYVECRCNEFYNIERVKKEVAEVNRYWGGYFVALENNLVIGAGGGGMINENSSELFVLYLNPERRNEGIGTKLLNAITEQQKRLGAIEQWVSVQKDNDKGIPFYEAKGFQFQEEIKSFESKPEDNVISLRYKRHIGL
ncbi:GNAT family N-acetyltransferase [Aquibacillus sp. 3ASR75-11]|uniref:GNAT family N-acetyltransferase n=1 Tax=Terrihalobacillus insolitus TaxID=2950438 RepID=A0A9X4ALT1_9BACI|nr:GNAT family N-acetyltransferase [Terrihalobacillus insolitus]MDC3415205.1 GNAT family N-acetyltransferase [Terrihalobacillus insolitus]MDC3424717.1 GNAT family N-acetyltransferase [Terrihalobacillus insolitus]